MKRPSLQFYPADWRSNVKLRRCGWPARGVWVEVLCLMHDSDEYGVLRWTLREIAQAVGAPLPLVRELADKGVMKGGDRFKGTFEHRPSHARRLGDPVVLVKGNGGPCWFSSRMTTDEWRNSTRGASTRFGASPDESPSHRVGERHGTEPSARQGDGSSSSSSFALSSVGNSSASTEGLQGRQGDAELACQLMEQNGCKQANPTHPDLVAAITEGVTPEALAHTYVEAKRRKCGNPFAWAVATARARRTEGPAAIVPSKSPGQSPPLSGSHRPFVPEARPRRDPAAGAPAAFADIASSLGIAKDRTP